MAAVAAARKSEVRPGGHENIRQISVKKFNYIRAVLVERLLLSLSIYHACAQTPFWQLDSRVELPTVIQQKSVIQLHVNGFASNRYNWN